MNHGLTAERLDRVRSEDQRCPVSDESLSFRLACLDCMPLDGPRSCGSAEIRQPADTSVTRRRSTPSRRNAVSPYRYRAGPFNIRYGGQPLTKVVPYQRTIFSDM